MKNKNLFESVIILKGAFTEDEYTMIACNIQVP